MPAIWVYSLSRDKSKFVVTGRSRSSEMGRWNPFSPEIKIGRKAGLFSCDAARGEVARASLYASTLYDYDVADNFTSAALCYDWNKNHPITDREMKRNNVLYTLQHNRNPFTDHPEFATMIWDASYNGSGALNDCAI